MVGVCREPAARQNEAFLTVMRRGRPLVILKVALSVDGCVSAAPGVRTALTGPAANRVIHRQRAEVDAIAIGAGTVVADDPSLTARGAYRARPLTRIVFDRSLRTPASARLFSTLDAGPVIVVTTDRARADAPDRAAALSASGARIMALATDDLALAFGRVKDLGVTSVVLEGGVALHRAALAAGVVDVVHAYITPRALRPSGQQWLPGGGFSLAALRDRRATWFGDDVLVEGHVHGAD